MSKRNPLNLSIGQVVRVEGSVRFGYDEDNRRQKFLTNDNPSELIIIGVCRKATGEYQRGFSGFDEYEPPSFVPEKYYVVYEAKESIESRKVHYILPEQITK